MSYVKTNWIDGATPASALNMNNIENGIEMSSLGTEVNIVQFGGSDNGIIDNLAPLLAAKAAVGVGGTIVFPKTKGSTTSVYYFSSNSVTDTQNIVLDVAFNTSFSYPGGLQYSQPLTLVRDLPIYERAINVTRTYPANEGVVKKHYIPEWDLDRSVVSPVLAASFLGKTSSWATAYSVGTATISAPNTAEAVMAMASGTLVTAGVIPLEVGATLTANFSTPTTLTFKGGVLVISATSHFFCYIEPSTGYVVMGIQKGASGFQQVVGSVKMSTYLSYNSPENVLWSVERISDTSFQVFANGINITKGAIDLGSSITYCGFGAYGNGFHICHASKTVNKSRGGVEPLSVAIFGDSLTADGYSDWAKTFKDAVDGSFGCRIKSVTNNAVGGATSTMQLATLNSVGVANMDYVLILIGTNDIQGQVALTTYIANVTSMVNTAKTAGARVVLGIPPMYYAQSFIGGVGNGQGSSNYEKGSAYRGAILRYAADNGIKIVDLLGVVGLTTADYDVVCDDIHPSFMTCELIGMAFAKAVLGDYLANTNAI